MEKEATASTSYLKKGGAGAGKVGVGCSRIKVVLKEEERQLYPRRMYLERHRPLKTVRGLEIGYVCTPHPPQPLHAPTN